jgi:hypothetical protein
LEGQTRGEFVKRRTIAFGLAGAGRIDRSRVRANGASHRNLGADRDRGLLDEPRPATTGYLYAVGHANGTATVINALGKVDGSFPDPVYFRWAPVYWQDSLNGA